MITQTVQVTVVDESVVLYGLDSLSEDELKDLNDSLSRPANQAPTTVEVPAVEVK